MNKGCETRPPAQYSPYPRNGGKVRFNSLAFRKLGALLYLFTTETCDISLVCLKLHNTVSIASKSHEEFCVTEIWLRWTAAM